ncbi:hypothetical protein [Nonomuraea sp. NPDC059022]
MAVYPGARDAPGEGVGRAAAWETDGAGLGSAGTAADGVTAGWAVPAG